MSSNPKQVTEFVDRLEITARQREPFVSKFQKWNQGSATSLTGFETTYMQPANIKGGHEQSQLVS